MTILNKRLLIPVALLLMVVTLAGYFVASNAFAAHDLGNPNLFELDRNAIEEGGTEGDDWQTLWDDCAAGTLSRFRIPGFVTAALRRRWVDDGWAQHSRALVEIGLVSAEDMTRA